MTKLLTDDELLGQSALLSDEDLAGPATGAAPQDDAPAPKRSATDYARDIAATGLKAAISVPETAVGLANLVTGGRAGKLVEGAGVRFEDARDFINEEISSEAQKAARKKVQAADGFFGTAKAMIENPSTIAEAVGESSALMGAGGLVGRGITAVAPRVAPWLAAALGEGVVGAGQAAENMRQESADGLLSAKQTAAAVGSGAGTAAFGAAGNKLAGRLGVGDVDTMIVRGTADAAVPPVKPKGFIRQVAEAGIAEGLFEELPQSAQEQMWQNYGNGRPIMEGVDKAAAAGLLTGGVMGAGAGGIRGYVERAAPPSPQDEAPPAAPPAPAAATPAAPGAPAPAAPAGDLSQPGEDQTSLFTPRSLTALDRVAEIERERATLEERLAELNRPEAGYGPMFDQERAEVAQRAADLEAERSRITASFPAAVRGAATSFSTESGAQIEGDYALIEADDLVTSHNENLRPNPAYPSELQPRERDRAASEAQISGIVSKLDPARLGVSADAATGAPIVGADGLVESGNARTIALKRVYQASGAKAQQYREFLKQNAQQFGLAPEVIDSMRRPVLVRVRATPVDRAEFARQANTSTVAAMSASEQARADAARVDSMEDLQPDDNGDFSGPASRPFIRRFMARLPINEQAGMVEADGTLSQAGYARVRNAVLAKAYGDSPVLRRMVESLDDNARNVTKALMIAAPRVAAMREAIGQGRRFDADVTPDLMAAVQELSSLRERGTSVADALAQQGIEGDPYSPETREILGFLAENARRPRRMADFIVGFMDALDAAGDPAQGSLLGETQPPSKMDLMGAARRAADAGTTEDPQRGDAGTNAAPGVAPGGQPAPAPGADGAAARDGAAPGPEGRLSRGEPAGSGSAGVAGRWAAFPPESGTLGIPRARMPQVRSKLRPALLNFLEARGIAAQAGEVAADELKPTQAEFEPEKVVAKAREGGSGRSVLVSSDGYVLDGHHDWMAAMLRGDPVKVLRLGATAQDALAAIGEFPSVMYADGADDLATLRERAVQSFRDALADLAMIASRHTRAAMMPESTPDLLPTLVRLMESAIKIVGTDLKAAVRWVKGKLREDPAMKGKWNKIPDSLFQQAASKALERVEEAGAQTDLFSAAEAQQLDLFAEAPPTAAAPAPAPARAPAPSPAPAPAPAAATFAKGDAVQFTKNGATVRGEVVSGPDRDGNFSLRVTDAGGTKFKPGAIVRQVGRNLSPVAPAAAEPKMLTIDGQELDGNAPNFGLQPWPKTLADDDPRVQPTMDDKGNVLRPMTRRAQTDAEVPREETWDEIVDSHFEGVRPAPADRKPIAYVMGGGGAAGKGTLRAILERRGILPADQVVHLDPDEIKKQIAEYREIIELGDSRGAAVVHEESSMLAKRVLKRAQEGRFDLVYDVTLGAPEKARAQLKALKDAGYEVRLFGVTIDPLVALVRADKRARDTGRYVPARDMLRAHKGFAQGFESYTEIVDRAYLYDSNPGLRDESEPMASKEAGGTLMKVSENGYNEAVGKARSIDEQAKTLVGVLAGRGAGDPVLGDGRAPVDVSRGGAGAGEGAGGQGESQVRRDVGSDRSQAGREEGRRGLNDGNPADGQAGAEGPKPGAVQEPGGEGRAREVRGRPVGRDQRGDRGPRDGGPAEGQVGQAGPAGSRAADERGEAAGQRGGARRNAGVPAGRDIPAKRGLNYRFKAEDLPTGGGWYGRARLNVEAFELVKKLQAEGRQATPEEQAKLAKFIGWGASEIASNIFGPAAERRDPAVRAYVEAKKVADTGRPLTTRDQGYGQLLSFLARKGDYLRYGAEIPPAKVTAAAFGLETDQLRWGLLRQRLKDAMTKDEWAAAARTTQYAHYTSEPVVRSIWTAVQAMGFKGGVALEPGVGAGIFPGLMPEEIAANTSYTGIEYDPITGAIAQQLFPDERMVVESFVDSALPKNFYDLAIGNPPFAGFAVLADPEYKRFAFSLHDYFFAKTIDRVKPGGLMVFVTSRYTMDKLDDKARAYMAERADLVGAIRLPQTAFKDNAGTEVVTDVLFLRKKVPGEAFEHAKPWAKVVPVNGADGKPLMVSGGKGKPDRPAMVNEYFAANPSMVLGAHANTGSMYADKEYTVTPLEGVSIDEAFAKAAATLPANIMRVERGSAAEAAAVREIDFNPKAKKEGNYYVSDSGALLQREGGVGVPPATIKPKDVPLVKDYVVLRDALKQAHYDQLNDGPWEQSLAALQRAYKAFTAKHGPINAFTVRERTVKTVDEDTGEEVQDVVQVRVFTTLRILQDDPDSTLVGALEDVNDDTGEIVPSKFLSERVLDRPEPTPPRTPVDSMLQVLNETGRIDMPAIASRLGISEEDTVEALGAMVYNDPERGWVTADEYLSGNVRAKLEAARAAARADRRFERNVTALEAAQPAPKTASQINVDFGMNWIPGSVYAQFLRDVSGVEAEVSFSDTAKKWTVRKVAGYSTARATSDWGTSDRDAADLLEAGLSGRKIRVEKTVGSGKDAKRVLDETGTAAAEAKLDKLRQEFKSWLWADPRRVDELTRAYNDRFNTHVARKFDGRHLTLPGASTTIKLFDHVKRGAWRIVQQGNTYLAHAVGSGKTFQMVASAMEQKRLGLIKKPMVVVPNHMLQQFAREWQMLYPAARLMVADEANFHTDNRRRFVSRVALSDLDAVIITHSAFKLLDLDPAFKAKMIEEQLTVLRAALDEAGGDSSEASWERGRGERKSPSVKRIEKMIEGLEQKLQAAMSGAGKDKNVRFDELGVDMLYVDEAHEFRKLDYGTSRQIKGIQPEGSQRALDLYMKVRYLEEKNPGRSLVMASGTPVTNTLAELYTVMRFMARKTLEEKGIDDFDSWAATFGRAKTTLEPNAAGAYEPVTRFNEFVNVPELTSMFREFADVLTSDHLAALLGDKRPKVEGGGRKMVITPQSLAYRRYKRELAKRVEASRAWRPSKDEPNNPDPIIKIIGDGRLAAIDMRFVSPGAPNDPNSKLNRLIDDVIAEYKATADMEFEDKKTGKAEPNKGASMMVFSDLGFGEGVAANRGFNARAWFEKRLRDAGIPPAHVAFMSDYKQSAAKLKLFKDVNSGRVRILVGSSKNMGTGVNAQQRLKALFHLDSPWFPADLEQREGRIIRQGNKNPLVRIFAYAAKGSYDEQMWSTLAKKQYFIDQALSGDPNVREIEDLSAVSSLEQASAMVAEDPMVMQIAGKKADAEKLERLQQAHEEERFRFRSQYDNAAATIDAIGARLPEAEKRAARVQDLAGDKFVAKAGNQTYDERAEWGAAVLGTLKDAIAHAKEGDTPAGSISGFRVWVEGRKVPGGYAAELLMEGGTEAVVLSLDPNANPVGVAMRAQNALADIARQPERMRQRAADAQALMQSLETRLQAPFTMAGMLANLRAEIRELEAELAERSKPKTWWVYRKDTGQGFEVLAPDADEAIERAVETNGGDYFDWAARLAAQPDPMADLDAEAAEGAAAAGMIPPIFLSRAAGAPADRVPLADLQDLADRVKRRMPGMSAVKVLASPADAPPVLRRFIERRGAMGDVEGAMHDGTLYLFASGLSDLARAEHVLAEHEAAHLGLRAVLGDRVPAVMKMLAAGNPALRASADRLRRANQGMSLEEAVEEVLVDMPAGVMTGLKGWRQLVKVAEAALRAAGLTRLANRLADFLEGSVDAQARADMLAAALVREARGALKKRPLPGAAGSAPVRLSTKLADDLAKQEQWLTREAKARGFKGIEDMVERDFALFEKLAELWRQKNPADTLLSRAGGHLFHTTRPESLESIAREGLTPGKAARHEGVSSSRRVSLSTSEDGASYYGGPRDVMLRTRAGFKAGDLEQDPLGGASSVTTGSVIAPADLEARIGGRWVPLDEAVRLVKAGARVDDASSAARFAPGDKVVVRDGRRGTVKSVDAKLGAVEVKLPAGTIKFLADHVRLASEPRLSVRPGEPLAQRVEQILARTAGTSAPIDKMVRALTRATGIEWAASKVYDRAAYLLDRLTPEKLKAGVVSDYGVPDAVIDQRAMMQGRQRVQLRQAGALIEKLSTLTRAESRVAYEWMNMDGSDPRAYVSMMQGLPEESVKVLQDVQQMIDRLSREAVRLGQLDPQAYERHKFAYLRRSYAKHVLEAPESQQRKRSRVIGILGEQYKGRGFTVPATMDQMRKDAPEWWERKLQEGKADKALVGQKFLRLELKANTGAGTAPLPGMTGRPEGKNRRVVYWPADRAVPQQFADFERREVFEVRDVKGPQVVLWRDYTKEEREQMGEIDEARFAIAKTLHGMIQDIEVGRYLEWLSQTQAKADGDTIPSAHRIAEGSESYRHVYAADEWVKVPESKIPGTSVHKYGKLAGKYLPGPIWNDVRQVVGADFRPLGETYDAVLRLWKTAKTALSPAVHMNNVMSNFVMADWHDVSAAHVGKALRLILAASQRESAGALNRGANLLARAGIADKEAAREILNRYADSGGDIGGWVTAEIAGDQLEPLLRQLEAELAATGGQSAGAQVGVFSALQHAARLRFPEAFEAMKEAKPTKAVGREAQALIDLYQAEDDVFRLAAWLKAKEGGATDMDAGKAARTSFLDYRINAPWVQAMRKTAWPFISFTYRAVPMLLHTFGKKPHKVIKLMLVLGLLEALGQAMAGGGDDGEDERKLLPEEKAGRIWGMVPKLIRMPWNDQHGSPVYLDIRRYIPVGDVLDVGAGQAAVPVLPGLMPGGPLVIFGEVLFNKSAFTGKPITLETDTPEESATKVFDHLYKALMPNILGLPGTYATSGVVGSMTGKTDAFGRELSTPQAVATAFGVKLGSYPADVLKRNLLAKHAAESAEIDRQIWGLRRQYQTGQLDAEEFRAQVQEQQAKKAKLAQKLREKMAAAQ